MKKNSYKIIIGLLIIIFPFVSIKLLGNNSSKYSVYSWEKIEDFEYIKELQIETIYQNIDELEDEEMALYIQNIKDQYNVEVYSLTGDPSWYKDFSGIKAYLDRITTYNENAEDKYKITGVVLDIEPWIIDKEWNRKNYANTMKKAYDYAKAQELKLVTVIPVWLDPSDLKLIIENCDRISIMNYNIDHPIELVKEEIHLARKYKKEVDIIAETQPINQKYGVEKNTTYYYEGYAKLKEDWRNIKEKYKHNKINFSYHDYNNLKEFMKIGDNNE
ncbi:MAG: hypothetical protein ACRCSG_08480 [Cellulosilyticaceae bacterium]